MWRLSSASLPLLTFFSKRSDGNTRSSVDIPDACRSLSEREAWHGSGACPEQEPYIAPRIIYHLQTWGRWSRCLIMRYGPQSQKASVWFELHMDFHQSGWREEYSRKDIKRHIMGLSWRLSFRQSKKSWKRGLISSSGLLALSTARNLGDARKYNITF